MSSNVIARDAQKYIQYDTRFDPAAWATVVEIVSRMQLTERLGKHSGGLTGFYVEPQELDRAFDAVARARPELLRRD